MADREASMRRYLAVWNGTTSVDELAHLVTPGYVGHLGSRDRDLGELKGDVVAYRARARAVEFTVMHRFSEGDYVATRLVVRAADPATGVALRAAGLNTSRWEDGLLAEEWAVWESLGADSGHSA